MHLEIIEMPNFETFSPTSRFHLMVLNFSALLFIVEFLFLLALRHSFVIDIIVWRIRFSMNRHYFMT